jgi:CHAT domain-containing protein/lipopolysaccharide biosynthesis regulator YciM
MKFSGAVAGGCGLALTVLLLGWGAAADTPDVSQRLDAARQLKQQGSMQAAFDAYEAILPELRSAPQSNDLAHAVLESSEIALARGDYPRAIARATEAAEIFGRRFDRQNEAHAINNVGQAYLYRGKYADALHNFERSLELHRISNNAEGEITLRNNIGNVYFFQGQYLDALQSYEGALKRAGETLGEPWNPRRRALTLTNLATLYERLGQNDRALDYYKQAMALPPGTGIPYRERAQLLSNAGTVYRRLGDPAKALETYGAAQQLFARERLSDGEIHILENIGIVRALDYQDIKSALQAFTEALHLAEHTANRRQVALAHLFRGEALHRMNRVEDAQREFEEALAGARQLGAVEEQWTAQYDLGRAYRRRGDHARALALFQQAIATIESVRSGLGKTSLKAEFLANKRDVYDASIDLLLQSGAPLEQLFGLVEQARSRNLQDALRNTLAPTSLSSVQGKLAKGSLLIEYWVGSQRMAALWMTRERAGIVTKPLGGDDLTEIQQMAQALPQAAGSAWENQARRIGELLLSGIPLQSGTRQVLIVPDGILHNLPFEALARGNSGSLLIEQCAVSYLPSAALLLKKETRPSSSPPWKRQLAGFGDPVVPEHSTLAADERWSRLPDSARELHSIASVLRGSAEVHQAGDDLKRHLVDGSAAGVPLLHFSTHAMTDMADPNRSRILFTPEAGKRGSEYLFWREVQALPLRGVELVTLSACDTEGGKLIRGEGIQSFSRAFLAAGAGATVTTLWRVADRPTAELMKIFYAHLARGETKADALRAAKLSFLHSGSALSQPQFWAAFVLTGDGQAPLGRVWSWAWLIVPAVMLAAAISGFGFLYFGWRRWGGRRARASRWLPSKDLARPRSKTEG